MQLAEAIKNRALRYFDGVGLATAGRPDTLDVYENWLREGFHGKMDYLRRHLDRKRDPQQMLAGAQTWIALSLRYDTDEPLSVDLAAQMQREQKGWIARYARGGDYHASIAALHEKLIADLRELLPHEKFLSCVDIQAVMERDVASRAGLGWVGKNTCLIDQEQGSFIFLSEILTTAALPPDKPVLDHCGTCTRCLDACPTQALIAPRQLDATRCISYWTIENAAPPPPDLAARFGFNFFGCDICQDVCPWNKLARRRGPLAASSASGMVDLREILNTADAELKEKNKLSALNRAKPQHLKQNARQVLENFSRENPGPREESR